MNFPSHSSKATEKLINSNFNSNKSEAAKESKTEVPKFNEKTFLEKEQENSSKEGDKTANSKTHEAEFKLTPKQIELMQKILDQKILRQKQIDNIIGAKDKSETEQSQVNSDSKTSKSPFPKRINLMKLRGNQFSFATLPIY